MRKFINEPLVEQKLVFEGVGQRMGMVPAIIEKDFWVVFLLDYLFNEFHFQDSLCFKGGTSLSKVYNYIERFSEDIDLAIDWTLLGYTQNEPYELKSRTKMNMFSKEIHLKVESLIKDKFLPLMKEDLSKIIKNDFSLEIDEIDKQTILFGYPRHYQDSEILQVIRIEFGALAEQMPIESKFISTYISEINSSLFEVNQVSVISLSPTRTMYEKLLILHREYNREIRENYDRYSRHYYDIYQMLNSGLKEEALNSIQILYSTIEFNKRFYSYSWAKYDEIYTGNANFIPSEEKLSILKKDYGKMASMIFGAVPPFETLIDKIREFEIDLNSAIIKDKTDKTQTKKTYEDI